MTKKIYQIGVKVELTDKTVATIDEANVELQKYVAVAVAEEYDKCIVDTLKEWAEEHNASELLMVDAKQIREALAIANKEQPT